MQISAGLSILQVFIWNANSEKCKVYVDEAGQVGATKKSFQDTFFERWSVCDLVFGFQMSCFATHKFSIYFMNSFMCRQVHLMFSLSLSQTVLRCFGYILQISTWCSDLVFFPLSLQNKTYCQNLVDSCSICMHIAFRFEFQSCRILTVEI